MNLFVALGTGAVLVGPAVAALATSPPAAAVAPAFEVPLTIPVIPVKSFVNVSDRGCIPIPGPSLYMGPSIVHGTLRHQRPLSERIGSVVWSCLDGWDGDLALSVSVDSTGNIRAVRADTADGRFRACVVGRILEEGRVETYGPGTLSVGYFLHRASAIEPGVRARDVPVLVHSGWHPKVSVQGSDAHPTHQRL